jgi:uncharacterized membrane protein
MAIHNDILLVFLAPFYFIHQGPETLLVIQSVILALGAILLYLLAIKVLKSKPFGLIIAFSYLIYPPLQRANIFDFHAVTLATSLLLFMFYFAYVKKYFSSFIFFVLAILSKENVALTTAMFGFYFALINKPNSTASVKMLNRTEKFRRFWFALVISLLSITWFILSIWTIIPYFRGSPHFALARYVDFGESPTGIIKGIFFKPLVLAKYLFNIDTLRYFFFLFFPLCFLSFFAPQFILICLPQLAVNLLSKNWTMQQIVFHYTSLITPFVFIGAVFGTKNFLKLKIGIKNLKIISLILLASSLIFSYFKGPLPYSKEADVYPLSRARSEAKDVKIWRQILQDENILICTSEHLGSQFTQRKVFYRFPNSYQKADYVLILTDDIFGDWLDKEGSIKKYQQLRGDSNFKQIYKKGKFEVYKRETTQNLIHAK